MDADQSDSRELGEQGHLPSPFLDPGLARHQLVQHFLALGAAEVARESQHQRPLSPQAGKPYRFTFDIQHHKIGRGVIEVQ